MNNISNILDPTCILLDLKASKKEEAIRELAQLLADTGKIDDANYCVNAIMEREKISSSGIGHGIAIPHRMITGVSDIMMAFGRKSKGVAFDSIDRKPAHLIFLIIGPQGEHNEYIKILSKLSKFLSDRSFFEALMKVQNAEEVMSLVREKEKFN